MSIDGATAVLLFIAAMGAALAALKVWVWSPLMGELRRREDLADMAELKGPLETIVAALTPDHGTSVADFVAETRRTVQRLEVALHEHCRQSSERVDGVAESVRLTNVRIDGLTESLAGVRMRKEDRVGIDLRTRVTDKCEECGE